MSSTTFAAQVDDDSQLAQEFEEYREQRSMHSKSEAVRTLLREGLQEAADPDAQSDSESESAETESGSVADAERGRARTTGDQRPDFALDSLILIAVAYWIGSVGLPASITSTVSTPGGMLFTVLGIVILIPLFDRLIKQVDWLIGQASSWLSDQIRTTIVQMRGTN